MRAVTLAALTLSGAVLAGCSQFSALQGRVAERGAAAADESLETGLFLSCDAATVGSVMRWAAENPQKLRAWQELCLDDAPVPIVPEQ